ncbi:pre-mRNA-splicing factor ATP-dependent RNA helicase DEAH1-like [Rosa rugosa]|uniref:pre-mRNA-splicing factor ATP-dependent RNA helicase DEAH1-like n=1 Tax=Rosa rugosa TaxID=74645 RepID=UPI002B403E64|nr:pre-mRNA-splicing factor ATP-dependent RNA helicase DEAH1-like [Rosa rugosa]
MAKFPEDAMLSKVIVASDEYKCSADEMINKPVLTMHGGIFILGTLEIDHIALLKVYNTWKEANKSTEWCFGNYIQARSMRSAKIILDRLERLLERVGIELTSNPVDLEPMKDILSGFFDHSAKLQHNSYVTATAKDYPYTPQLMQGWHTSAPEMGFVP